MSHGVVDLIESGHLDEAHRNFLELETRFPDQIDQVIDHHRRCLAHIHSNPDGFDSDSRAWYRSQIDRLRKPSTSDGSK